MQKLIATKRLKYGSQNLDPGDEFEASDRDAKTLSVIGSARYSTRVMTATTARADTGRTLHLKKKKKK